MITTANIMYCQYIFVYCFCFPLEVAIFSFQCVFEDRLHFNDMCAISFSFFILQILCYFLWCFFFLYSYFYEAMILNYDFCEKKKSTKYDSKLIRSNRNWITITFQLCVLWAKYFNYFIYGCIFCVWKMGKKQNFDLFFMVSA